MEFPQVRIDGRVASAHNADAHIERKVGVVRGRIRQPQAPAHGTRRPAKRSFGCDMNGVEWLQGEQLPHPLAGKKREADLVVERHRHGAEKSRMYDENLDPALLQRLFLRVEHSYDPVDDRMPAVSHEGDFAYHGAIIPRSRSAV